MAIFEKVSKYANADIAMPVRKTAQSAGYDMVAAEDYIIPSLWHSGMRCAAEKVCSTAGMWVWAWTIWA